MSASAFFTTGAMLVLFQPTLAEPLSVRRVSSSPGARLSHTRPRCIVLVLVVPARSRDGPFIALCHVTCRQKNSDFNDIVGMDALALI